MAIKYRYTVKTDDIANILSGSEVVLNIPVDDRILSSQEIKIILQP